MKSISSFYYGNAYNSLEIVPPFPPKSMSHSEKAKGQYFKQKDTTFLQSLQLLSLPWSHEMSLPQIVTYVVVEKGKKKVSVLVEL